jgi:hypothetical protein
MMMQVGINGKRDELVYMLCMNIYIAEMIIRPSIAAFNMAFSQIQLKLQLVMFYLICVLIFSVIFSVFLWTMFTINSVALLKNSEICFVQTIIVICSVGCHRTVSVIEATQMWFGWLAVSILQ